MTKNKVRLADCCIIKPPKSEAKTLVASDDLVSFVPMKNLGINTPNLFLDVDKHLSEVSGSYTYFADNDVLLAKITPCFENGKLGIAKGLTNGVGFGSSEFIVFRSKGNIISEYLYYYLLQQSFRDSGKNVMTGAVGHKRVPKEYIENREIPLPSLEEQKKIVVKLDQAFADIEKAKVNAEKNLKNARELFDSYLQKVFRHKEAGWVESDLKRITSKIGSGATPRGGKAAYKEEGMSLIRSMNVHDRLFKEKNLALIDDSQAEKLKNVALEEGDVLLNITGASVARCCVVPDEFLPARVNQHVSIIRADKTLVSPKFLCFLLTSTYYKNILLEVSGAGSTREAITKVQLQNFVITYPNTVEKQEEFLDKLTGVESQSIELQSIYAKKIRALDELKQSILQKAFNGELV